MTTYRVYFEDSNIRLFETDNIHTLVSYILFELNYNACEIMKIEKVFDK